MTFGVSRVNERPTPTPCLNTPHNHYIGKVSQRFICKRGTQGVLLTFLNIPSWWNGNPRSFETEAKLRPRLRTRITTPQTRTSSRYGAHQGSISRSDAYTFLFLWFKRRFVNCWSKSCVVCWHDLRHGDSSWCAKTSLTRPSNWYMSA